MHSRCGALSLVLFSLCFYFSFSLSFASFLTSIFAPRMLPATCLEIGVAWAVPCACQRVCACVCVWQFVCVSIYIYLCLFKFDLPTTMLLLLLSLPLSQLPLDEDDADDFWLSALAFWHSWLQRHLATALELCVCGGVCVRVVARLSHDDDGDGWWQYLCKWSTAKATRSSSGSKKLLIHFWDVHNIHTHTQSSVYVD